MFLSRATAFAALALASAAGVGSAAAPGGRDTVQVGPVSGGPEKDTLGLARAARDECDLVPLFARGAVFHGPRTGDPEKDSLGLRVAGQYNSCDGTIR